MVGEPFPHLVIEDAIDPDLCRRLIDEFPPLSRFVGWKPYQSNQKITLPGRRWSRLSRASHKWSQEHEQPSLLSSTLSDRIYRRSACSTEIQMPVIIRAGLILAPHLRRPLARLQLKPGNVQEGERWSVWYEKPGGESCT